VCVRDGGGGHGRGDPVGEAPGPRVPLGPVWARRGEDVRRVGLPPVPQRPAHSAGQVHR